MPGSADVSIVIQAIDQASSILKGISGSVGKMSESAKGSLNSLNSYIDKNRAKIEGVRNASAIAFGTLTLLGGSALTVAGSFEKYNAILTNALGSQIKSAEAMNMIRDISSKTPFELEELTQSYISLVNRGFIPTQNEIVKLGDLASSQGKGFQQLVEALLDAQTGEFERLKEFGVRASKSGDTMSFTFKGVTTKVQATDEAIKGYILSLGDLKSVSGQMATISGTLEGKQSNLGDSISGLGVAIGTQLLPYVKPLLDSMISTLGIVTQRVNENPKLAATIFGIATAVTGLITVLATIALSMSTLGPIFAAIGVAVGWLTTGFTGLWSALLGPIGLVILGVGLLYLARQTNFLGIREIVASFVGWITGTFVPFIQGMYTMVVSIFEQMRQSISTIFNSYMQIIRDIFTGFVQLFSGDREGLSQTLQDIWNNLWIVIGEVFGVNYTQLQLIRDESMLYLSTSWSNTWTSVKNFFSSIWSQIKTVYTVAVQSIGEFFAGGGRTMIETGFTAMLGGLVGLMKGIINGVTAGFEAMVNSGINSVNALIDAINRAGSSVGLKVNVPRMPLISLPRFAFGGIVEGANGIDKVPALLSPGELILNKAQQQNLAGQLQGSSGQTVYITFAPQIYGSKESLAEEIMDDFMKQFRQNTRFESY